MTADSRAELAYAARWLIPVAGAISTAAVCVADVWYSIPGGTSLKVAFADSIRQELFSSMIAVASFLLAMKALVIGEVMRRLESDAYREEWERRQGSDTASRLMDPARNVSSFLTVTIAFSVLASMLQFTVGLIEANWAIAVCVGAALTAIGLLVAAVALMQANIEILLGWAEKKKLPRPRSEE